MAHRTRIAQQYGLRLDFCDWLEACFCCADALRSNELCVITNEATKEYEARKKIEQQYKSHAPMSMTIPEENENSPPSRALSTLKRHSVLEKVKLHLNELKSGPPQMKTEPKGDFSASKPRSEDSNVATLPLSSTSGNVSPTLHSASPKGKGPAHINDIETRQENDASIAAGVRSPGSISTLELHSLNPDLAFGQSVVDQRDPKHTLGGDRLVTVHQGPSGLHALHLDPVIPVAPEERSKSDAYKHWLNTLKAPEPLAPKVHRLSQDIDLGHAPGAYPTSSPPPPPSPAPPELNPHDLGADSLFRFGPQQREQLAHRLSEDIQVIASPRPVARWPYGRARTSTTASGKSVPRASGPEVGDEIAPTGEQGIELHELVEDVAAPIR